MNNLNGINIDGVWVEDPLVIKEVTKAFFIDRFKEIGMNCNMNFDRVLLKRLQEEQAQRLVGIVTEEEIKQGVWDYDGNKSPGQNGYNFTFY